MGVTHKLKTDIVDFIVQTKRNDPNLSCRALSDLVWKKFKKEVSKSSVNSVLKEANLSSKVGRRNVNIPSKTFTLPDFRKKQFFESMQQAGINPNDLSQKTKKEAKKTFVQITEKKVSVKCEAKQPSEKVNIVKDPEQKADKKPVENLVEPNKKEVVLLDLQTPAVKTLNKIESGVKKAEYFTEKFVNEIQNLYLIESRQRSKIYPGVGVLFLLAAKWEFWGSRLFNKILGNDQEKSNIYDLSWDCEIWQLVTGQNPPEELLKFYPQNIPKEPFPQMINEQIFAAYDVEKKTGSVFVNAVEVVLSDGKSFYIDPFAETITQDYPVHLKCSGLNVSLSRLSKELLTNIQILSIRSIPYKDTDLLLFSKFVHLCEKIEGLSVLAIKVFDQHKHKIAEFKSIPKICRFFVAGCWRGHPFFSHLTKNVKNMRRNPFYSIIDDRVFTYTEAETKITGMNVRLKAIILWLGNEEEPIGVLLTNSSNSADFILNDFFSKHPLLEPSLFVQNSSNNLQKITNNNINYDFCAKNELISDSINFLHDICSQQYFPPSLSKIDLKTAINLFYGLSGTITRMKNFIKINIILPEKVENIADIGFLVFQINRRALKSPSQKQLFFSLEG